MLEPYIQLFGFIVRTVAQSKEIAKMEIQGIENIWMNLNTVLKVSKILS